MTIQQLEYILEVNRTGSITQAAKNLFVTQSGISSAISALEDELGFPVFSRNWKGAVPTQRGLRVLEHAARICEHRNMMLGEENAQQGPVRIETSLYTPLSRAFVRLCGEYGDRGQNGLVHRSGRGVDGMLERLRAREADLAVLVLQETSRPEQKDPQLVWQLRKRIPVALRIGPGHPLYHKAELTAEDFRTDRIIDDASGVMMKASTLWKFVQVDLDRALLESDRTTRYEMVAAGLGYTLSCKLPESVDRQYGFRSIPLEGPQYEVYSVTGRDDPVRQEVCRYLELVDEELADL